MRTLVSQAKAIILAIVLCPTFAFAYTNVAPTAHPLIVGQLPFQEAVKDGDWTTAKDVFSNFLDTVRNSASVAGAFSGDPSLASEFIVAMQTKDKVYVTDLMTRVLIDQIEIQMATAQQNLNNYEVAYASMVFAMTFFKAVENDVSTTDQGQIDANLRKAMGAVGSTGVLGFWARNADLTAFNEALSETFNLLESYTETDEDAY